MEPNKIILSEELYSSSVFWERLISLMISSYEISYFTYDDKNYINCTSLWYDHNTINKILLKNNITLCHENNNCTDYLDCYHKDKYNFIDPNTSDVEYNYFGTLDLERDEEFFIDEDNISTLDENITNMFLHINSLLSNIPLNEIIFSMDKNIKMKNKSGFNHDHRGSDHTLIKLPFKKSCQLNKEFSMQELLTAITNMKSHKFDENYEMFCSAKANIDENINVTLIFSHGS